MTDPACPLPLQVRKTIRATKLRQSLKPGTVLILLAGRFRGKRVILINNLDQGTLLVTGPFKINGVPIRRVNARYVIATSTKVDIKSIEKKLLEKISDDKYFAREKSEATDKKKGEDAFFKQGEKPEVRIESAPAGARADPPILQKKKTSGTRAEDQKGLDKAILTEIRKTPFLESYLASSFSLRKGDKPHEMVF
jgi:large subunit ribosomal protein L6e